jgi:hypothetical protein
MEQMVNYSSRKSRSTYVSCTRGGAKMEIQVTRFREAKTNSSRTSGSRKKVVTPLDESSPAHGGPPGAGSLPLFSVATATGGRAVPLYRRARPLWAAGGRSGTRCTGGGSTSFNVVSPARRNNAFNSTLNLK